MGEHIPEPGEQLDRTPLAHFDQSIIGAGDRLPISPIIYRFTGRRRSSHATRFSLVWLYKMLLEELRHLQVGLLVGFPVGILRELMDHTFDAELVHSVLQV